MAAVILEGPHTESQVLERQLIENCLREDLQPIEQARAFRTLMDCNGWAAARLAEALHLTGATVSRVLALLDLLYTVQEAVNAGELAPSVAYEMSKLDDPNAQREVVGRPSGQEQDEGQGGEGPQGDQPDVQDGRLQGDGREPARHR